jgi:BspA type Leucine rich repeat region (6 copies)/Secretion system C-terminal sorting domain
MKRIFTSVFLCTFALSIANSQTFFVDGIRYDITSSNEPLSVEVIGADPKYSGDIVLPSTVEYLENNYSLTNIGDYAFSDCSGLTSIVIPNSVTSIGEGAFAGCSGLTSIEIPNSVTSIGKQVFYGCTGLSTIEIPNSVTSIGDWAFLECSGLTSIDVVSDNNTYASIDGVVYNKDISTLLICPAGKTSAIIPNSVTSIGDRAFDGCTGLTSIECYAIVPPSLLNSFSNVPKVIPLFVPDESVSAYQVADGWKDFLDIRPISALYNEQLKSVEMQVYPNPFRDVLNIKGSQNSTLKIYNISGQQVFSENIHENENIDLRYLPSGVYMLKMLNDGKSGFVRLVKE